ncbi:helix-turn-helix transcriptional regulator [Candidatus Berkelbacteria bacterium]|nr:helix-turn-helix transcriptional regulator [Candidatus Berkelbacteria bacterium]
MQDKQNLLPKRFGKAIKSKRLELGISQEELGFRTGLDRTYISGIERGQRNPSLKNIGKLADALEVKIGKLFEK